MIMAPTQKGGSEVTKEPPVSARRGFSAEEKAAVRARARELKASAEKAEGESAALASISSMPEPDRHLAERFHEIVRVAAPSLTARTWYGMPAYAKDGNVVCWFKNASKFKTRYATIGFSDEAKLDDGYMWPTEFALTKLTGAEEAKIAALVKRAVG